MVKQLAISYLVAVLVLSLFLSHPAGVVKALPAEFTDAEIFAQAEEMGLKLGLPTDSSETAPAIDPGGQITRTTECSWLYGRPKTDKQVAIVICEYQIKVAGMTYVSEDGTVITNNLILSPRNAAQVAGLLDQMTNPQIAQFRKIAANELRKVQAMTFIASRNQGVTFPTPAQFTP